MSLLQSKMNIARDLIAKVRDEKTMEIVSDLQLDAGVNIFYRFTRKKSLERHPDYGYPTRFPQPRYSPRDEVGRSWHTSERIGGEITDYGNWIKMEEKGYLEPEIEKVGLDLDRVIYARDWDDVKQGISTHWYIDDEIRYIKHGEEPKRVCTSNVVRLTCGFEFYSITDDNRLRRDQFTAYAMAEDFDRYVSEIEHQREIRGSGNRVLRAISKAIDGVFRKDHFERDVWELNERCFNGD